MNARTTKRLLAALFIMSLWIIPAAPALADGLIIPVPPPEMPPIEVPYLTVKYHHVTVTIDEQVATTHVDQVFINEASYEIEGTYIFPLPEEATIGEFSMWVDGQKHGGPGARAGRGATHLRGHSPEPARSRTPRVRGPRHVPGQHLPHPGRRREAHRAGIQPGPTRGQRPGGIRLPAQHGKVLATAPSRMSRSASPSAARSRSRPSIARATR